MKITKTQLKQIIKEELEKAMFEAGYTPSPSPSPEEPAPDPRLTVKPGCEMSEREATEECWDAGYPSDDCIKSMMRCKE